MRPRLSHVTPESAAEDRRQLEAWRAKKEAAARQAWEQAQRDGPEPEAQPQPVPQVGREPNALQQAQGILGEHPMFAMMRNLQNAMAPPPPAPAPSPTARPSLAAALATPPDPKLLMRLQREEALANGEGVLTMQSNTSHGSYGYALHYLAWQKLMKYQVVETGPHPFDREIRFTLTPAGERAREELLRVRVEPGQ